MIQTIDKSLKVYEAEVKYEWQERRRKMYKPFFSGNIFAYIEFLVLFIFLLFLLYKNNSLVNGFYMNRFSTKTKIAILLITIPLHTLIYVVLDTFNTNWVIGVAVNAFILTLIVYLTVSIFFRKSK